MNYIEPKEKKEFDNFLLKSNWNLKLDKYAYIYEGCQNDEKLFIGGKKEMIIFYCGLFPRVDNCKNLKKQTSHDLK